MLSLLDNVDTVQDPDFTDELRTDFKAQVKFLIAYYHYMLIRCYGPVIIITGVEDVNQSSENYKSRTPLDDCVDLSAICSTRLRPIFRK